MKLHTKQLTLAALTAAAYAVLSYFGSIFGITYGPIQCRFSEALCVLPFFLPETAWGLGVGCLIANLLSPYGVLDIVVGSAATLLAALLTARCQKKWLAPLPPVVLNTLLVGAVIAYEETGLTAAFPATWAINGLTVGAGEAIACYGLGMLLLWPSSACLYSAQSGGSIKSIRRESYRSAAVSPQRSGAYRAVFGASTRRPPA